MNKDQTIEAIKVMQAFVDGKTIMTQGAGEYNCEINSLSWDWNTFKYRIKPEPRDCYVLFNANNQAVRTLNEKTDSCQSDWVRMREVIE